MSVLGDAKFAIVKEFAYFCNTASVKLGVWSPKILSLYETLDYIVDNRVSVARFGDGEFKWMLGVPQNSFQTQSAELQQGLLRTLNINDKRLLLCMPDCFGDLKPFKSSVKKFWSYVMFQERRKLKKLLPDVVFGNLNITRFYIDYKNTEHVEDLIKKWKELWREKDLLIVEGELTRLGVGNDLFDNVHSIRRILAPPKDAFSCYSSILYEIEKNAKKDDLILIALGPTATILAGELALKNYWAIDIGHIDIEYEWYKMGATSKVPVKSKYVNEAGARGRTVDSISNQIELEKYRSQIIKILK